MLIDTIKEKQCVLWGAGECLKNNIKFLSGLFEIQYICDSNKSLTGNKIYDIQCISPDELTKKENVFVIITIEKELFKKEVHEILAELGIPHCEVDDLKPIKDVKLSDVLKLSVCDWADENNNRIHLGKNFILGMHGVTTDIEIQFSGFNNIVEFGDNVINFGTITMPHNSISHFSVSGESKVYIGSNTEFGLLNIFVSENSVCEIGCDCLISGPVEMWQAASHPIYDLNTQKRLNISKNISIGEHVWIGRNATFQPGAKIGSGCVVGFGSITSSQFPSNVLIAGVPAKILRKDICWTKDSCFTDSNKINCIDDSNFNDVKYDFRDF